MLEVFDTLSSKVYFEFTIEGDKNYNCSTGASVTIYLWGFKFNDIRYESLKLNQYLPEETSTKCTFIVDDSLSYLIKTKYADIMNVPGFYNNTSWN